MKATEKDAETLAGLVKIVYRLGIRKHCHEHARHV